MVEQLNSGFMDQVLSSPRRGTPLKVNKQVLFIGWGPGNRSG